MKEEKQRPTIDFSLEKQKPKGQWILIPLNGKRIKKELNIFKSSLTRAGIFTVYSNPWILTQLLLSISKTH